MMNALQKFLGALVVVLLFTVPSMAGESDWNGKLLNATHPPVSGQLNVVQWGAYIEGGTFYFAQKFQYDMVNEFKGTSEGAWANWWINADNNTTSGIGGGQITDAPWGTAGGIDIAIEIGRYQTDPYTMYFTNGADNIYQGNYSTFAFSPDGTFVEGSVSVSDVLAAAVYLQSNDATHFGVFDETAAATAAAAGDWSLGTRLDGKDVSLGINYGASYEGLATTPTPEPATMIALTLGGIALLKRRRGNK